MHLLNCVQFFYKITQFTTILNYVLYIKLIKEKLRNKLLKSANDF